MQIVETAYLCYRAGRREIALAFETGKAWVLLAAFACLVVMFPFLTFYFVLGIASSIGFGFGVPTRTLILIPHVVSTAALAPTLFAGWLSVLPVCIAHGVGSAVGELPPFLAADTLVHRWNLEGDDGPMAKSYQWFRDLMRRRGTLMIVLLATWPNASFDMAGLASGTAKMPLSHFLGATILGKAFLRAPATAAVVCGLVQTPVVSAISPPLWLHTVWKCVAGVATPYFVYMCMEEIAREEKKRGNNNKINSSYTE